MQLLDCTLRDGGYYTQWDFPLTLTKVYFEAFNQLPVDWLEIGYRSPVMPGYYGQFYYCSPEVLERVRAASRKKLVVILNEKDVPAAKVVEVLAPCRGIIDMVRLAIDPKNIPRALSLAEQVKKMGFQTGFNVMYMSTWATHKDFAGHLKSVKGLADIFYMVDSFGGVYPEDIVRTIDMVRSNTDVPLGFHGHNNLELGLINSLTALDHGVEMIDATVTGMGRGAGNLKTELLLAVLDSKGRLSVPYNALSKVVDAFTELQARYGWGTNLPYMVSGAKSLPQKQVMEWVGQRWCSFDSILQALSNQAEGREDNRRLPHIEFDRHHTHKAALIVGGGPSAVQHAAAIESFLEKHSEIVVIHASSKNAMSFRKAPNDQYFCLVGNEGHRLEEVFGDASQVRGKCILPPYPRKMGTYVPSALEDRAYELKAINFTDRFTDSHTALALQTAIELGLKQVYFAGYDGYASVSFGEREHELFRDNEIAFAAAAKHGLTLKSLTPTQYTQLEPCSVYALL